MDADERRQVLDEVRLASSCSHPIRLNGEMVDRATGEITRRRLSVACKDRREVVCPACSATYQADAWILVSAGLIGGKGVDESAAEHPKAFSTLYINMIRAGESSGALDVVLTRLADFTESSAQLRNKLIGAMIYPAIMICVGVAIIGILFVVVIPKVTKIFEDMAVTLPWTTVSWASSLLARVGLMWKICALRNDSCWATVVVTGPCEVCSVPVIA